MTVQDKPVACIEAKPTRQSIEFGGAFISLSAISRAQGIDQSYLSRIFNGDRTPSLPHIRKICSALGMGIESFLSALDSRVEAIECRRKAIIKEHNDRILREDRTDIHNLQNGHVPPPRLPVLRAS